MSDIAQNIDVGHFEKATKLTIRNELKSTSLRHELTCISSTTKAKG